LHHDKVPSYEVELEELTRAATRKTVKARGSTLRVGSIVRGRPTPRKQCATRCKALAVACAK
jgi:hypothetical protein